MFGRKGVKVIVNNKSGKVLFEYTVPTNRKLTITVTDDVKFAGFRETD